MSVLGIVNDNVLGQDAPGTIPGGSVSSSSTPGTFGDGSSSLNLSTGDGYAPQVADSAGFPPPTVPADGKGSADDGYKS